MKKGVGRKNGLLSWAFYTVVWFIIMLIAFDWKVSVCISLTVGFLFGMLNKIIHLILIINQNNKVDDTHDKDDG